MNDLLDKLRTFAPFGRGAPSDPTEGELLYAIGDIHGRYDLLLPLIENLACDWQRFADGRRPILIFCGDYVDRGAQSAEVLEAMIWLKARTDIDARLLKGNHEDSLMRFIDRPDEGARWLGFGGEETLQSYGVAPPDAADAAACSQARDALLKQMPPSHLRLLKGLKPMVVVGSYAFVHAGVRPGRALDDQDEQDLLWIRDEFLNEREPFEKLIVHGHTWIDERLQIRDNRLGIDTGAYATGVLTAVRLDGQTAGVVQARGAAGEGRWSHPPVRSGQ